jgi:hypothetical protein
VVLLALVGCGPDDAPAPSEPATDLRIEVWPDGKSGELRRWTLTCGPAGGDLPDREAACERLAELENPFAPIPADAICTQIYGGPAVAEIRGTQEGTAIETSFARTNGCEIDRWDRHRFLLPVTV